MRPLAGCMHPAVVSPAAVHLILVGTAPEGLLHGDFDVPFQRLGLWLLPLLLRMGCCCCAQQGTRDRTKLYQNISPVGRAACMHPRHGRFLFQLVMLLVKAPLMSQRLRA